MLEAKHLIGGYPGKTVLKDISLSLSKGELIAVLGLNGSGKSTLLKILAGLLEKKQGTLLLEGKPLCDYAPRHLGRLIAYHGQRHEIPDMNTRTLLAHSRYPYQGFVRRLEVRDQKAIEQATKRMQLQHVLDTPLKHLSGGYQQRSFLAMTLAREADYLLFDEPDAHLDISQMYMVHQLLQDLASEGHCVVASFHDISEALRIASRIILIDQQTVAFDGKPQDAVACGILETTFRVTIKRYDTFYRFSLR
ncbi:ABC transporter ATP-binding protein [Sphaerochaeta sp. S2]|uniref:ABC transporter ATP-binding protein n=1 Tax=Sphaerochaeta sp. S2 TaxID=2798868 RepID=UPI0018E91F24|nr:ABC transporter ATP-binding protein [Sphaerochaeta sp. S2]MBJ2356978.1 ABC transporter ATP-binding protein [Sphaerochaeta sp. S2]